MYTVSQPYTAQIKFLFHRKFTFGVSFVVLPDNSDVIFTMRIFFKTHFHIVLSSESFQGYTIDANALPM